MSCGEKDITINYLPDFSREFKRLAKKYKSLLLDLNDFKASIRQNPSQGVNLGRNLHKVRLAIASKGGGKSGGARVITYVIVSHDKGNVSFVTIYDKSERSSISDKELKALLKKNGLL